MNKLDELRQQVQKITEENKPSVVYNSQEDRKIREFESELTEASVKTEFSLIVSEINQEVATTIFGSGTFKRDQYKLSWTKWENGEFRLVLTNIPHNNSKLVIKLPDVFKKDVVVLLENFTAKFSAVLANKSE